MITRREEIMALRAKISNFDPTSLAFWADDRWEEGGWVKRTDPRPIWQARLLRLEAEEAELQAEERAWQARSSAQQKEGEKKAGRLRARVASLQGRKIGPVELGWREGSSTLTAYAADWVTPVWTDGHWADPAQARLSGRERRDLEQVISLLREGVGA